MEKKERAKCHGHKKRIRQIKFIIYWEIHKEATC